MNDPAAATPVPAPRSRWRRWRIGRWLLVAMLTVLGSGAWRVYDFAVAQKEAKALGWVWHYDDPIEAIRKDWKAAFRKATWTDGSRYLGILNVAELARHAGLLRRLAPKTLNVSGGPELRDLSALKGLSTLQQFDLGRCDELANVDALKGLSALRELSIGGARLTNVEALKELSSLQWLRLTNCTELTNVDALKGLPALQKLNLFGCTKLSAEAIAALRAGLPKVRISDP